MATLSVWKFEDPNGAKQALCVLNGNVYVWGLYNSTDAVSLLASGTACK